ncbi:MAG: YggT family protein [Alphaproteobacteria bacterium]
MESIAELIYVVLDLYKWCLIAFVIMSWLIAFNVVNTYNRFVFSVNDFLYKITEPALRPIRRIVPNLGGVDISPVILILIIWFLQRLLERNFL